MFQSLFIDLKAVQAHSVYLGICGTQKYFVWPVTIGPTVLLYKKRILINVHTNEPSGNFFISFYCTTSLITDYKYTYVTINGL